MTQITVDLSEILPIPTPLDPGKPFTFCKVKNFNPLYRYSVRFQWNQETALEYGLADENVIVAYQTDVTPKDPENNGIVVRVEAEYNDGSGSYFAASILNAKNIRIRIFRLTINSFREIKYENETISYVIYEGVKFPNETVLLTVNTNVNGFTLVNNKVEILPQGSDAFRLSIRIGNNGERVSNKIWNLTTTVSLQDPETRSRRTETLFFPIKFINRSPGDCPVTTLGPEYILCKRQCQPIAVVPTNRFDKIEIEIRNPDGKLVKLIDGGPGPVINLCRKFKRTDQNIVVTTYAADGRLITNYPCDVKVVTLCSEF